MSLLALWTPLNFGNVTRAHVIAWRKYLETVRRFAGATIRRKLATLSALYQFLCERNAVTHNVVSGVKRPKTQGSVGTTPAISDEQMRQLLAAPNPATLKGKRDRAILATLGYHGIRRQELCDLLVRHYSMRDGVMKFEVHGKGDKIRYLPVAPLAQTLIADYLDTSEHRCELDSALFRPVRNNSNRKLDKPLNPSSVLRYIVKRYGEQVGITFNTHGFCVHSLRVTSATKAWENGANIVDIQHWLGHANITTTRSYFRQRDERIEQSPSFKISYSSYCVIQSRIFFNTVWFGMISVEIR